MSPKPPTITQFAKDVDISLSMASRILHGTRRPSLPVLDRVATVYPRAKLAKLITLRLDPDPRKLSVELQRVTGVHVG